MSSAAALKVVHMYTKGIFAWISSQIIDHAHACANSQEYPKDFAALALPNNVSLCRVSL